MVSLRRLAVVSALVAVAALGPGRAEAAPSREEGLRADALFTQAKRALAEGRVAEACTLFAESQRLDPGGGTLYNLARCHEREGKTATAHAELVEALALARGAHRLDAEETVQVALRELEPRLSRLRVRVDEATAPADLVVELDGRALGRDRIGLDLPLDPGPHAVAARAAGRDPFAVRVDLGPDGDRREVLVRFVPPAAAPPPPTVPRPATPLAKAPAPPPPGDRASSAGPYVLGAVGLAGVAVGAVLGGVAMSRWGDAKALCPARECADPAGVDASTSAKGFATGSTVAFAVGLGSLGAAVAWKLLAPRGAASGKGGASVAALAGSAGGGALVVVPW